MNVINFMLKFKVMILSWSDNNWTERVNKKKVGFENMEGGDTIHRPE